MRPVSPADPVNDPNGGSRRRPAARGSLTSEGGRVRYDFKRLPAVVAAVAPGLVAFTRQLPTTDFMEPVVPGGLDSQDTTPK